MPVAGAGQGAPPDEDAGAEVLDLAFPVDGGVRDDRDRLLEELREVGLLRAQGGQLTVEAEAGDGLGALLGEVLDVLLVPAVPAERDAHVLGQLGQVGLRDVAAGPFEPHARPVEARALAVHALQHETLDVLVGVETHDVVAEAGDHLLAGREGRGVADHAAERDDAALGRPEVLLLRLAEPQGAQAERVDAEDALGARAGDDRGGALREGTAGGAQAEVGVLQAAAEGAHLAQDGREHALDRLEEAQAVVVEVAGQDAVEVLRVAAAREGHAELQAFLAQAFDGVDLAVVREEREGLDLLEGAERVGGVAVVPDGADAEVVGVAEVRVVAPQDLGAAADLVDDARARQADHVDAVGAFEFEGELEEGALAPPHGVAADERGDLHEDGFAEARDGPERAGVDGAVTLVQDLQAVASGGGADRVEELAGIVSLRDEEVADAEVRGVGGLPVEGRLVEEAAPEPAGDVRLDAAAVALAAHLAAAVGHA